MIGIGKMPITVHYENRSSQLVGERIARVDAHHEIGSEISAPGACIAEVVLCVQGVVADEAGEDSGLHC